MSALDIAQQLMQAGLAVALFVAGFCRLTHTTRETIREIRFAVVYQTAAALTVLAAPWLPLAEPGLPWAVGTTPEWTWLMLLSAGVCIQIATARHWAEGVPRSYIKPECRPMRRARDTGAPTC